jgi:hypothetical protein
MSENSVLSAEENKANLAGPANGGHSPPYEFADAPAWSVGYPSCPIIPVFHYSIVPIPGVQDKANSGGRACRRGRGGLS